LFPRVTPHDLRHTAASLAVSAGANVKAVQKMLGHKSAVMTLDSQPTYLTGTPRRSPTPTMSASQGSFSR
jgi:integrase